MLDAQILPATQLLPVDAQKRQKEEKKKCEDVQRKGKKKVEDQIEN